MEATLIQSSFNLSHLWILNGALYHIPFLPKVSTDDAQLLSFVGGSEVNLFPDLFNTVCLVKRLPLQIVGLLKSMVVCGTWPTCLLLPWVEVPFIFAFSVVGRSFCRNIYTCMGRCVCGEGMPCWREKRKQDQPYFMFLDDLFTTYFKFKCGQRSGKSLTLTRTMKFCFFWESLEFYHSHAFWNGHFNSQ